MRWGVGVGGLTDDLLTQFGSETSDKGSADRNLQRKESTESCGDGGGREGREVLMVSHSGSLLTGGDTHTV